MAVNLALLILEVLFLGSVVVLLHRVSPRYGLTPLIAFIIGLTVFLQASNTTLVYIQLFAASYMVIAPAICVSIILMAMLILYVVEGTIPARLTIFSILGVSLLYFLLLLSGKLHLSLTGGGSFMGLTPDSPFISPDLTSTLASLAAFVTDLFMIAIVYQGIKNYAPRLPVWIAPGFALLISLWSDTVLYQLFAYGASPDFFTMIADDLLGKTIVGLVLWPLVAFYLIRVAPRLPGFRGVESRPTFDLLFGSFSGLEAALARSEAALRESEDKFRSIFEQSNDSIVLCNEEGRVIAWNQAAEQLTGLTRSTAFGQYYWDIQFRLLPEAQATPTMFERTRASMLEALQTGQAAWLNHLLEGEIRGPAGERRYIQQVASPIPTKKGFMLSTITRDISERKLSEEALRSSEALYQSLVQILPMSICRKDADGRFTFVNQRYCAEFERPASEIMGKTDFDLHPVDLAKKYREDDQMVMASGQTVEMVEEHEPIGGERTYVQVFKSPTFDASGRANGVQIVFWDVTERKRAEQALHASEARFRTLIENASDMILVLDDTGSMTYASPSVKRIMGYAPTDLIGQSVFTLLHPDDAVRLSEAWPRMLQQLERQANITTVRVRHADGTWHVHEGIGRNLMNEPAVAGIILNTRDVTDRQRAESQREATLAALRESEQRYRTLVETFPDIVMITDFTGQVLYANAALENQTGLTLQELQPPVSRTFIHPDDVAIVRDAIDELLTSDRSHTDIIENRFIDKYDRVHWYSGIIARTQYEGQPVLQTVTRDVTARKQIEAEREKLIAELESRNAELERFTYTVSHDLKSPLVTIMGFLGLVQKDALAGDIDQLQLDMQRIAAAAERMQYLLQDLLELSRVGRKMNPPEAVPLADVVQEALMLTGGRADEHVVQIGIVSELPVVYGDRVRLVEVLQNLIDNACKFMGDQPEPRVTIGRRGTDRDGKPIVFVQDNGIGIESDYHEKVFGLFDKLDSQSEGTGIGLALVKRIVEVHGGRIWVESAGAKTGSTFYFTLPIEGTA